MNNNNKETYDRLKKLDAETRHKKFIEDYFNQKNKTNTVQPNNSGDNDKYKNFKTDYQILKENHQFLREDDNGTSDEQQQQSSTPPQLTWEEKLAKTYYNRLYKEYAIIDLTRYKSGEIGLRWRIQSEVISGRGQFTCANKKCESSSSYNGGSDKLGLKSFEVPFSYNENNENKVALVKVVLCPLCTKLLNYSNIKKKKKELKLYLKEKKVKDINATTTSKKKRKYSSSDSDSDGSENEDKHSKKNKTTTPTTTSPTTTPTVSNNPTGLEYEDVFQDMFL